MKRGAILAAALAAQVTTVPPANMPVFTSLVQDAGTDVICALHADTIAGMTCGNAVTDATTETAFAHGVTIPAGALSNNTITVNSAFLIHPSSASLPTLVYSLRLGGINGTKILQTPVMVASASGNMAFLASCTISALAASSASTPLLASCSNIQNNNNLLFGSNILISNTTRSITADTTTAQTLVWTVQYSAATASNAIGLYSMFNGIR
jgi:hypothetical protein